MVSVASSVWNFCPHFSGAILRGHQWWRYEMSDIFSGYYSSFTEVSGFTQIVVIILAKFSKKSLLMKTSL